MGRPLSRTLRTLALAAIVSTTLTSTVARAETAPLRLDPGFTSRDLGLHLEFAYDSGAQQGVDDVRGREALAFAPSKKAHPNFGYRTGAEWVRIELDDERGATEPLVLLLDYGQTDRAELFLPGSNVPLAAGDHVPRDAWPIDHRSPAFPVPAGTKGTAYLRVTGTAAHQLTLELHTQSSFEADRRRDGAIEALYFGAILAIASYNFLVASLTRSKTYAAYVAFLLCFATFQAGHLGLTYQHLVPHPGAADFLHVVAIAMTLTGTSAFARRMLPTAMETPRLDRALRLLGNGIVAIPALYPLIGYSRVMRIELPIIGVGLVLILAASTICWRRGSRTSGLFLLAWGAFVVGTILAILRQYAVVPSNAFTENAQQVGSLVEALLLSFALADRIKELQEEVLRKTCEAQAAMQQTIEEQAKTARELRRLDRLKDEFFANTSHELRTPVHAILGLSEALIERGRLGAEDRELAETITRSGRRLATIVASVVDFAALKNGDLVVEPQPTDLARLVQEEIASLPREGVPISLHADASLGAALVDGARLRQAVAHLLSNAKKFTREGHIDVQLRNVDDKVELAISDTGVGIGAERLATIFDGFEQGDGSSTREAGGLGIGLAVAKRIVVAHRGTITLDSAEGKGTVVVVRLPGAPGGVATVSSPVREVDASRRIASLVPPKPIVVTHTGTPSAPPPSLALPKPAPLPLGLEARDATTAALPPSGAASLPPPSMDFTHGDRIRLLVADDDPVNRRVIQMQLGSLNFELVEAVDGVDALDKLEREGPFDGVLLDVMMPRLDGYGVCRELRKVHAASELPVLMLTAKTRVQDLVAGFEAGANDYVPKPFAKAELLARIRTHVTMSRTSQAMSRFVPRESLALLGRENVVDVRLGDTTEHDLAVLFADVRGFTQLAESLGPTEVFALLNQCYARVAPEVRAGGGFVDKYIGDAVMALFPAGPSSAVHAALRMQRALRSTPGLETLDLGIGIHVGPTLLGTLGEPARFEATVISDAVNVAARLESFAKRLGASLIVSREVATTLDPSLLEESRSLGTFAMKGKTQTTELIELFSSEPEARRAGKVRSRDRFAEARSLHVRGDRGASLTLFAALTAEDPSDKAIAWWARHVERGVFESDDERRAVRLEEK